MISYENTLSKKYTYNKSFYPAIACEIMKNNSNEYIVCEFGSNGYSACIIFDKDIYKAIDSKEIITGGQFYKSAILPEEMETGLICAYSPSNGIIFLIYDITTN